MKKRVVVTGLGTISPVGNNIETFWENLISGKSGIGKITKFDTSDFSSRIAGEVKDFDESAYFDRKEAKRLDNFAKFAIASCVQAVNDSGIDFKNFDPGRGGVIFGSGIGGMETYDNQFRAFMGGGPKRISPYFIVMMISDIVAGHISIRYNLKGQNFATTSACATANHAIGVSYRAIQNDEVDVMICGGSEAAITSMGLGGFCSMKALSTRNDEPEKASRPFDAKRDGFVMSEGGGVVILESLEHAEKRNANIYCEIGGIGFSADAYHLTAPDPEGQGAIKSMKDAISDAGLSLEDIDYINAHGTSTPYNDKTETTAIKKLFGEYAYKLSISSTKSMTGHLLGAAGVIELISSILTVKNSKIPPTINYEYPDPECDLNYTPNKAVDKEVNVFLNNAFGFGGHNATILGKKFVK